MNSDTYDPITIVIADDHPVVRTGFTTSLAPFGIKVTGEACSADDVIPCYERVKPDVLLLDIRFGETLTGLDVAIQLLKLDPAAKIVFVSQFNQDAIIQRTYQIGGKAFLAKNCDPSDLASAIRKAKTGDRYYQHEVAEKLAELSLEGDKAPDTVFQGRDLEIFKLLAKGLTIVEISEALQLSVKTISNTRQNIMDKLSITRPAEITRLAIRYGLIEA